MYKQLARNLQYKISVQYMLKDKSMHRILPKLNLKRYKTSLTVLPYSIALECLLLYSCVKFAKRGHFSDKAPFLWQRSADITEVWARLADSAHVAL